MTRHTHLQSSLYLLTAAFLLAWHPLPAAAVASDPAPSTPAPAVADDAPAPAPAAKPARPENPQAAPPQVDEHQTPLPPAQSQVPEEPGRDAFSPSRETSSAPGTGTSGQAAGSQGGATPQPPPPLPPVPQSSEPTPGPEAAMAGRPTGLEPPRPDTWLDASHAAVERLLFKPVIQFDRFFSDERELDAYRARSFVRIRTELEVLQNTRPAPGISLYANLQFPGMGQWMDQLHLVVSGDTTETGNPLFPEEGGTLKTNEVKAVNAELRLSAWESLLARIDVGTGVLFTLPPGVFVRARYRAAVPITELFLTRFATQAYWQSDTGPGTRMDIALERPIEETTLVRLSGHGDVNQRATRGVEYASELAFLHALGPRRAIALAGTMEGASGAPAGVDKYRAYLRYRQDLFRRWIFVEVEPEVVWPWALQQPYRTTYGATFRFELQFQGIEPP